MIRGRRLDRERVYRVLEGRGSGLNRVQRRAAREEKLRKQRGMNLTLYEQTKRNKGHSPLENPKSSSSVYITGVLIGMKGGTNGTDGKNRKGVKELGLSNPFKRVEFKGNYAADEIYDSGWGPRSVNCVKSNGGLCCNCLVRKAKIGHHMMYIPLWRRRLLELITSIWKPKISESQLITFFMKKESRRLKGKEKTWFHIVGVCPKCHKRGHGVHHRYNWISHSHKILNHNSQFMIWKLRLGWIITWTITIIPRLILWSLWKFLK